MSSTFLAAMAERAKDGECIAREICPICFEDFSDASRSPAACSNGHAVCKACWGRWLKRSTTCPICRAPVSDFHTVAIVPRERRPLRVESFQAGVEIAWIPQGYSAFLESHSQTLNGLDWTLVASGIYPGEELMRCPDDGTANAALILSVQHCQQLIPGLTLLRLRAITKLCSTRQRPHAETVYLLPVLDCVHCDVDQHVVELSTYTAAMQRFETPFANDPRIVVQAFRTEAFDEEELWEGRVFDTSLVDDEVRYPHSRYRSLHVAWYCAFDDGRWAIDEEQTNNVMSPWEAHWSMHEPSVTRQRQPSVTRQRQHHGQQTQRTLHVFGIGTDETIVCALLQRLLSNEASAFFFHPPPGAEATPCLQSMSIRSERSEYQNVYHFANDMDDMIAYAFMTTDDSSTAWILTAMMQSDWRRGKEEVRAAGLGHLLEPA